MKREELIKFFKWLNDFEELLYTDKGINFYIDEYLSTLPDDNENKLKDCTTCQFLEVDGGWECNKCDEYYSNWTKKAYENRPIGDAITLPDEKGCETCKYDPQKNKICLTCDDHYSKYKSNQP